MDAPRNNYIRSLSQWGSSTPYEQPRLESEILWTPDKLRWRIETSPKVSDLLRVGDLIRTSYGTGGIVVELRQRKTCCCPLRSISRTKYCLDGWDEPQKATRQYHVDVWAWAVVYVVEKEIRTNKDGTLRGNTHFCYLNDFVAFDGRILHLFANNPDEIFLERSAVTNGKTFQMPLIYH